MDTVNRMRAALRSGRRRLALALCSIVAFAGACSTSLPYPDLGGLYSREAQYHGERRNPIIVIPGILGSRLVEETTGQVVWGAFAGDYAHPGDPDGARLVSLPMREGIPLRELEDTVVPDGVLDRIRVNLLGLSIEQKAYFSILATLGVGGYRDELLGMAGAIDYGPGHFTCFQFDYDWRRDNAENAQRLNEFIVEKKAYVEEVLRTELQVEDPDVKFDIVAHSMGGLVTRYFLRHGSAPLPDDGSLPEITWAGAENVERVILVGTPNAGSAEAIAQLVEGIRFAPILPSYSSALLGTMPSIYQLFPRPRHGPLVDAADPTRQIADFLDLDFWVEMGWGLASPDVDAALKILLPEAPDAGARRRMALDHLGKCLDRAKQFNAAIDRPAERPDGLDLFLFAGDAVDTNAVLTVDLTSGKLGVLQERPGDGTVVRTSALMDERVGGEWSPSLVSPIDWSGVVFLFTDHITMTKDPAFADNVLYLLLEDPRAR